MQLTLTLNENTLTAPESISKASCPSGAPVSGAACTLYGEICQYYPTPCHGDTLYSTKSECRSGVWQTKTVEVVCPECPSSVPAAGDACTSDGEVCPYHPVNCHGDEIYNTTSICVGRTWTTRTGQATMKPQPSHCAATGDVITEGDAVFAQESGCRWTTDRDEYKTVLRSGDCMESVWVVASEQLPFQGCSGMLHVVFRSDEAKARDINDVMEVIVDGETKLVHNNDGCNPVNCPTSIPWTAEYKELRIASKSSNAQFHRHMMIYDISFEPSEIRCDDVL